MGRIFLEEITTIEEVFACIKQRFGAGVDQGGYGVVVLVLTHEGIGVRAFGQTWTLEEAAGQLAHDPIKVQQLMGEVWGESWTTEWEKEDVLDLVEGICADLEETYFVGSHLEKFPWNEVLAEATRILLQDGYEGGQAVGFLLG